MKPSTRLEKWRVEVEVDDSLPWETAQERAIGILARWIRSSLASDEPTELGRPAVKEAAR